MCTIVRYGYVWNVHRMSIKIEHRNPETRKIRNDFLVQVRNFLLPLSLKVLRYKKREAQSFYSGFFICPPLLQSRAAPAQGLHVQAKVNRLLRQLSTQLNSTHWLFKNSPNPLHASGAWHHSHLLTPFPIWAIVTSLSDTYSPPAHVHLNACVDDAPK